MEEQPIKSGKKKVASLHPVVTLIVMTATFGTCLLTALGMPGQAQETSANFSPGSVKIGNDTRPCTAGLSGSLRYSSSEVQYCNSTNWKPVGGVPCTENSATECSLSVPRPTSDVDFTASNIKSGVNILGVTGSYTNGCTAPALCPNVGNVCDDGVSGNNPDPKFAGFMLYGASCEAMYTTQNYYFNAYQWKTSSGVNDIANDSVNDGKVNDAQVPNSTSFPGFKLCKDLVYGGYSDWYLPARDEMYLMLRNASALSFPTSTNLTSTEFDTNQGYGIHNNGYAIFTVSGASKTNNFTARCVRRD